MQQLIETRHYRPIDILVGSQLPAKNQAFGSENRIQSVLESDLQEIQGIQRKFDAALGRTYDAADLLQRSYNPVIDVFHLRQLQRNHDKEGKQEYLNEISVNMATNLRERYQVSKSTINYTIDGDKVYSQHFPHESFDEVLARGVAYRLQHKTPEPEREGMLGEQAGWKIIQDKFTDSNTAIGFKMTTLSPPGLVENTAYKGRFIDEYELARSEEGAKYIKLTRKAVKFDEGDFDNAALSLDPKFFEGYDGRPWDAWMLSHPIEGALNLTKDQIDNSADFAPNITSGKLRSYLDNFKRVLQKEPPDYVEIAINFNAFINLADEEHDAWKNGEKLPKHYDFPLSIGAIQREIDRLGRKEVKTVVGGGCPPNKGFNVTNLVGLNRGWWVVSVKEPGVSQFSVKSTVEKKVHCNSCPQCGEKEIDATVRGGKIICPINGCTAPYAC